MAAAFPKALATLAARASGVPLALAAASARQPPAAGAEQREPIPAQASRFAIRLDPTDDDVRFATTLRDTATGLQRQFAFDDEGASDPTPFQRAPRE